MEFLSAYTINNFNKPPPLILHIISGKILKDPVGETMHCYNRVFCGKEK